MQEGVSARQAATALLDSAYNFARFLSRDPKAAERIVHAAYLRARRIDTDRRDRIQLLKFVRECCSRGPASGQREERADVPLPMAVRPAVVRSHDPAATAGIPTVRDVRAAIETLPDQLREVLVLKELEKLSYGEIAEVTSLQTQEIMSRLACARRLLAGSGRSDRGSESFRGRLDQNAPSN
jgi:DNA-directed RNA polymerase specialized sigma24 family protein